MTRKRLTIIALVIIAVAVAVAIVVVRPWEGPLPSRSDYGDVVPLPGSYDVGNAKMPETRPTVPGEWITSPSDFDSEEDEIDYESNWHSSRPLRAKYGLTYVTTDAGQRYVAGELLVVFYSETTADEIDALASEAGAVVCEVNDELMEPRIVATFVFPDDTDVTEYIDVLSDREGVQSVTVNSVGTIGDDETSSAAGLTSPVDDPDYPRQTYLVQSGFDQAWYETKSNGGIVVAVIDSGIDMDHPDLADNIVYSDAYDILEDKPLGRDFADENGHGTVVSGIIAGVADNDRGIAGASYNARILPIRIADLQGYYDAYDSAEAIHYLMRLEEPPEVINMSYGSNSMNIIELSQINEAIQQKGITCVAAAGNYSREQIESGATGGYCYPASYEGVISVGAVTADNQHCDFSYVSDSLDVCALGIGVFSTTDPSSDFGQGRLYASSYVAVDPETGKDVDCSIAGTSFAAPQVSAAAALLKVLHQDWKSDQIKSCLERTAKDLGTSGRDDEYGYGLLDAAAAVGRKVSPGTYSDPYSDLLRERGL